MRAALLCAALCFLVTPAAAQQSITSGDVTILHWPGQQALARSLLPPTGAPGFAGLPADILNTGQRIVVYLAPDEMRFDSLTGGRAPEWGAGVADPQAGVIVVPGYVSDRAGTHELPQILRHELAHVALQRHLGTARVPRWFTEGYATWVAGEFDESAGWQLRLAFATGSAPPLDSITLDWPRRETSARLAYLLSGSAVRYLYSLGDVAAFERFLRIWRERGTMEPALREAYVVSGSQFERLWIAHVKRRYGWLQVVSQAAFVWLVLTLLVMVMFIVRRRRDRNRMDQLRTSEPPDEPAYWNEELEGPTDPDGEPRA